MLVLTGMFMLVEFIGGYLTDSLALTADAGHMLSDVGALALSFFAMWISSKPASFTKTYGFLRTEILAAFINGIALIAIALLIIYEAYIRISTPPEVKAPLMIIIAVGGLIINVIGVFLLHSESKENINVRAAFLHIIGDLLGSVGAIVAGLLIYFWHLNLADPLISIFIAILILISAGKLVNEAVNILLEAVPAHIDVKKMQKAILELPNVLSMHDLHVWSVSHKAVAMSAHIVTDSTDNNALLCSIGKIIQEDFGIKHSTIQLEHDGLHSGGCSFY